MIYCCKINDLEKLLLTTDFSSTKLMLKNEEEKGKGNNK